MLHELEILEKLQEIDITIAKLRKKQMSIPQKIEQLETELKEKAEKLEELNTLIKNNQKKQKHLEIDIGDNNQEINNYENQLLSVKTNREYKALNSEIATLKEHNSKIEEELITLMEKEVELKEQRKELGDKFEHKKAEIKKEGDKIRMELSHLSEDIKDELKRKENLAKSIDKDIYSYYNRLIAHKGTALARVKDQACQGCHFKIRPQLFLELMKNEKIIYCENCGRILIYKGE